MAVYSVPSSSCFVNNGRGSSLYFTKGSRYKRLAVIKVQSFQDEGKSTSIVDANLRVLKERMEMVKVKERLERCCRCQNGWNYNNSINNKKDNVYAYDHILHQLLLNKRTKKKGFMSNLVDLTALASGTLCCTCLSGALFLCLVSMLVHLQL